VKTGGAFGKNDLHVFVGTAHDGRNKDAGNGRRRKKSSEDGDVENRLFGLVWLQHWHFQGKKEALGKSTGKARGGGGWGHA